MMKAVILSAGFGKRLKPLTNEIAKPAVYLFDRPLVSHIINQLHHYDFSEFCINLHHCSNSVIKSASIDRPEDVSIRFYHEKKILGTGGALAPMKQELVNQPFLIINGDIIVNINFRKLINYHLTHDAPVTMVLHTPSIKKGFPGVGFDTENNVTEFPFKTGRLDHSTAYGTFCGISVCNPTIYQLTEISGCKSLTQDLYLDILKSKIQIKVYPIRSYWNDVGRLDRYLDAHFDVLKGVGLKDDSYWKRYQRSDGIFVGENVQLNGCIKLNCGVSLGNGVIVNGDGMISDVVVWPNLKLNLDRKNLQRAVVYKDAEIVKVKP